MARSKAEQRAYLEGYQRGAQAVVIAVRHEGTKETAVDVVRKRIAFLAEEHPGFAVTLK